LSEIWRNGSVSGEVLSPSLESPEEENIQNLKYLRHMRRVRDQQNVMNCEFLQRLIGAMTGAVAAKQNCAR
jgi:hypothetical protein